MLIKSQLGETLNEKHKHHSFQ